LRIAGGRAEWPSLFVFLGGLLLLAASLFTERWIHWGGVALLLLAWAPWRTYPTNALGVLVALYCACLLGNGLFVTPYYSTNALYQPLMLFGGFAAVAGLSEDAQARLFRVAIGIMLLLVLFGLSQYFLDVGYLSYSRNRASATFVTPATFGTAVILFLAPISALYLARGSNRHLAIALLLFAGLVASESRGAMLAFAAALAFVALMQPAGAWRAAAPRATVLLCGLGAVWLFVFAMVNLSALLIRHAPETGQSIATWVSRATADRAEIYARTLVLILEHPFGGAGAGMFYPLFEAVKPDDMRGVDFIYAHNDYLQVWLEFGAPGFLLLLSLVAVSLIFARRLYRRMPEHALPLVCGAALAACFAHSMVDFPLYIPFVLLVVGGYLGSLARRAGGSVFPAGASRSASSALDRLTPPIRWALAVAALAWLAQPAIAELMLFRSLHLVRGGEVREALYWQSVARRFDPRHPVMYWTEATLWREQAALTHNPVFAQEADTLYAQGMRANPYEIINHLGRAKLHRDFPELLKDAASPAQVVEWSRRAVELRPQQIIPQVEYARSLAKAGRVGEARVLAQTLAGDFPGSASAVRRLQAEL
jgi:O-antigen ligase